MQGFDPSNPDPASPGFETLPPTPPGAGSPNREPRGRLAWLLLDPRGLQMLMVAGGGLLALGVVLWLAVVGVFDDPLNAAVAMGVGNLGLIAAGAAVVMRTPYRVAGRAVAMLGCLLLPLNLWFYDAQGLVTLDEGGHLWLAALAACVVYAAVARLLKDSLFVYAFVAGVAMAGLLLLADARVERLWEVVAPSTLLVTLGVACVHAERLFPTAARREEDEAFTRGDFGRAFFRAGHASLGSGLGVLLAGRVAGRFYEAVFVGLGWFTEPDVATLPAVKGMAMLLALAGAYTYAYSQLITGAGRRFTVSSWLTLAWALVIGVDLLGVPLTEELGVGLLAIGSLGCQLTLTRLRGEGEGRRGAVDALTTGATATAGAAVALTTLQLMRAYLLPDGGLLSFEPGWRFLVAAALTLAAQVAEAWRRWSTDNDALLSGVALAAVGLVAGMTTFVAPAFGFGGAGAVALLAAAPVVVLSLAGALGGAWRSPAAHAAAAAATLVVVLSLAALFAGPSAGVATLYAVLAAVYTVSALTTGRLIAGVMACVTGCVALGEAIVLLDLGVHVPLLAVSGAGLAAVLVDRLRPTKAVARAGRVALVLSGVAGALLAANRLVVDEVNAAVLGTVFVQAAMAVGAAALTPAGEGRRGLWLVGLLSGFATAATLDANLALSFAQRLELGVFAAGLLTLAAGHAGWRREAEAGEAVSDNRVDLQLWAGSLLTAVPVVLGLLGVRLGDGSTAWAALHDSGVLAVGLGLLGSGVLCRLRATTLTGAGVVSVYLASLVMLVHVPDQLQSVAVYLMVGGAVIFGSAVLLSVYRDRLLTLPDRIREGDGVFAVLKWR